MLAGGVHVATMDVVVTVTVVPLPPITVDNVVCKEVCVVIRVVV
jgi:hypothetical protein